MYRTLEFRSALRNEWQFGERGNPTAPGSRELVDRLIRELGRRIPILTPVEQHSYYGWAFTTRLDRCTFQNVLNPGIDTCFLAISIELYWLSVLLRRRPKRALDRYVRILDEALRQIEVVSDLRWHSLLA